MSLTIQQALEIANTFRNGDLHVTVPNKGDHFNKDHIKALSSTDRKVCFRALSQIERAQLAAFSPDVKTPAVDLSERVKEITDAIAAPLSAEEKPKKAWYKRPFIWIAKLVHSIILWFKNTFFGRVSSDKLWNKVETYLNDVRNAHTKMEDLRKDKGLIQTANESLDQKAEEQRAFLKQFKVLVEVNETLHYINSTAAKDEKSKVRGLENFRAEIQKAWIVDNINADVIKTSDFKAVIVREVESASPEVQAYLNKLLVAAKSGDENTQEVADLFDAAAKKLSSDFKAQEVEGTKFHKQVQEAHDEFKKLKSELELLTKKYPE